MRQFVKNILSVLTNKEQMNAYLLWLASQHINRRGPTVKFNGGEVGGFSSFSAFWGTMQHRISEDEVALVRRVCRRGGIAFDIGANLGMFSIVMSRVTPALEVHAFEPISHTFDILRENLAMNRCDNVIPHRLAISERKQIGVRMTANRRETSTNRILRDVDNDDVTEIVDTTTIDEFCIDGQIQEVSLVKIDVEGLEPCIIDGARNMMRAGRIGCILLEVCPANLIQQGFNVSQLYETIRSLDYFAYRLGDGGHPTNELDSSMFGERCLENVVLLKVRME